VQPFGRVKLLPEKEQLMETQIIDEASARLSLQHSRNKQLGIFAKALISNIRPQS
jgi:hypothetical protein